MGVYFDDSELVIITWPKSIRLDLTEKVVNSLKYEIDSVIRHNE